MKLPLLNEVFMEALPLQKGASAQLGPPPGSTAGVPGESDWSISAADLKKKAHDPEFIAKLKQHTPLPGADLANTVASFVSPFMLKGVSDEVFDGFLKKLKQILDTKRVQAEKMPDPSATGVGRKSGTQPTVPGRFK